MKRALLVLGWFWALPTSLIGLLVASVAGRPVRLLPLGVWHWWARPWFLRAMPEGWEGITFGAVTILREPKPGEMFLCFKLISIIRHERNHTVHAFALGPFFLPAYLLMCAMEWAVGKDPYRANPLEVDAYVEEAKADAYG